MVLEYLYEGDSTTSLGNQFQCTGPTQQHSSSYSWGACNAPLFCPLSLVLLLGATVKSRYALGGDLPTPPPRAAGCGTTRHRATTGPPTPAPTGHHRAPQLHPQLPHNSTHRATTAPQQFPQNSTHRATTSPPTGPQQFPHSSPTVPPRGPPQGTHNSTHSSPTAPPLTPPTGPP